MFGAFERAIAGRYLRARRGERFVSVIAIFSLIGIALGAYGLTQACLQVPFGWLSDHWGRKRTIYLGLVIFAIGSFVAAIAHSVEMVIVGRIIQGAGAISAAVIALAADLTRDDQRTKAMAIIGMTIGATFALSTSSAGRRQLSDENA